jgi:hypothetical protein
MQESMKRCALVGGFVSLSVSGAAIVNCGSSPSSNSGTEAGSGTPTFTDVYTEILQPSCGTSSSTKTGCHQATADVPASLTISLLDMSSQATAYTNLVNVRGMGTYCSVPEDGGLAPFRVLPDNAQESLLYLKVAEAVPPCGVRMPRPIPPATSAAPLAMTQISLIQDWINAGAKNN